MKVYMFHYVTKDFNYPHFDEIEFENIIKEIKKNNKIISLKEYDKFSDYEKLNCVMLTFDDGTIDHYEKVYKILKKLDCSGLFFITSSIFDNNVLDIQIIHRLLSLNKFDEIYQLFLDELSRYKYDVNNIEINNIYDSKEIAILKKGLQNGLPYHIRKEILNKLIKKYNISNVAKDYYISVDNLKEMKENDMYFGIHTKTHPNLEFLTYDEQYEEISYNLDLLIKNNLIEDDLITIAYPYGGYNDDTIKILKRLNIKYGFKAFKTEKKSNYEIDRIDCVELK